jgi:hypothetical protein
MTTTEKFATFIEIAQSWGDYVEKLEKENQDLKVSRDWYESRCVLLGKVQKYMRDPERQIVCDILANNTLFPDPKGERYGQDLLPLVKTSFFPKDLEDIFKPKENQK